MTLQISMFDRSHERLATELTEILHKAYEPLIKFGMAATAQQSPEKTLSRLKGGESFLGFVNSEVVPTITMMMDARQEPIVWYKEPGVFWFTQFAIKPTFQGKGLGAELLDFAEAFAKRNGASELAFDTSEEATSLIAWYQHRNYRFIDYCKLPDVSCRSIVLSKNLLTAE